MSITHFDHFPFPKSAATSLRWLVLGVLLAIPNIARPTICTTVTSGAWNAPAVWVSGIRPQRGDTAIISVGDSVSLDISTVPLGQLTINGSLYFVHDTLLMEASANPSDTLIIVNGTLDAGSGWFLDSGTVRPIIHCAAGSLFRTSAVFPFASLSIFDSTSSPLFALDSGSTFEYYSENLDLIDISYLLNNIFGHAYQNLTLRDMVASFRANPLVVRGTLHIGFGASTKSEYTAQTITISGDVVNDNEGESGSVGAGLRGCGMLSLDSDTWIFDARPTGAAKDTCHWSGPSQLGTVIIRAKTVLSVRFINDTLCDSLDILNNLIEEGAPCGGHFIGRVFSEFPSILDSTKPMDNFHGFGLTIKSGTDPYLGRTRVMRTSGYPPPGANPDNHPVLRYYRISPGDGPQQGIPDNISIQIHCDEWNGANPTQLHFWRSRDRGATWAFSGRTSYHPTQNLFTWDTSVLGWPNGYGSFYWMLSEGYMDTPLPVELENFTATQSGDSVFLAWQTASETNLAGFELDREAPNDSELISICWSDDSLRARSPFGAFYDYADISVPLGTLRYNLYDISQDGIRQWLASATPAPAIQEPSLLLGSISYTDGTLSISLTSPASTIIQVVDAIGRSILWKNVSAGSGQIKVPILLLHGAYFIEARSDGKVALKKFVIWK